MTRKEIHNCNDIEQLRQLCFVQHKLINHVVEELCDALEVGKLPTEIARELLEYMSKKYINVDSYKEV